MNAPEQAQRLKEDYIVKLSVENEKLLNIKRAFDKSRWGAFNNLSYSGCDGNFNGKIKDELFRELRKGINDKFNFQIELWPVKRFLNERGFFIKKIIVEKKANKYNYEIIKGLADSITIDLTAI